MIRKLVAAACAVILALGVPGCGDSPSSKSSPPTVPDPNGITIPKPAGKPG